MPETENYRGAGPWRFDLPRQLSPGETWKIDFRHRKYNGQRGWFKKYLPLDVGQVTNQTSESLTATYNGQFDDIVVPNTQETFTQQQFVTVEITNDGDAAIAAGDVAFTAKKEPYGADERAREKATRPWLKRALNDAIPGGLP